MLDAPVDLAADEIAACIRMHWQISVSDVTYVAMGHGSCNWIVHSYDGERWFVKADRSTGPSNHATTYETAALLFESGLDTVLAPIRDREGILRRPATPDWDIGVYPYLDGDNPDFADDAQRAEIAAAVGQLHAHRPMPSRVVHWTPRDRQADLEQLLANRLGQRWDTGPFGEPARRLLIDCTTDVRALIELYQRLLQQLYASDEPWVVTHGEPHGGNTMVLPTGRVHLIDCDDMMLAPRERDLWLLLSVGHQRPLDIDNRQVLHRYQQYAGPTQPRQHALDLFRAGWHLSDISSYARRFSQPHDNTADLAAHWASLNSYLPATQNWPKLLEDWYGERRDDWPGPRRDASLRWGT